MKNVSAVVLAAGVGSRMKAYQEDKKSNNTDADVNKVVEKIDGIPMLHRCVDNIHNAGIDDVIVVVGHASESVKQVMDGRKVRFATQILQEGTGDAFKSAIPELDDNTEHILSVYGDDSAFYPPELILNLIESHVGSKSQVTILTLEKDDPVTLGRIIRNIKGQVVGIVEEKNATDEQKAIKEINTGLYVFEASFIKEVIHKIQRNPVSGEYYLTDIIEIASDEGKGVNAVKCSDESVWFGINTPEQLENAQSHLGPQK